jgi:membrane associated rhomboid family serine protease
MNPSRSIRQAPVSVCVIWAACILFVGVYFDTTDAPDSRNRAMREWGAGLLMVMLRTNSHNSEVGEVVGSTGPMQVWDGRWWRLLVNNLHHGGLFHLFLNGCVMIYLGRIIERRMSTFVYLLFLLGSAFAVAALTGLTGKLGVGLSGVAYAQVGLLMVWRDRDESVAEEFTLRAVLVFGVWLLFCQVSTYTRLYPFGNTAHYTGLIYGWLWGQVYLEEQQKGIFRFLFAVSHLLLYPAFWFILHPFWLGSWHWYQSQELDLTHDELIRSLATATSDERSTIEQQIARIEEEQNSEGQRRRKVERLQTAVLLDPTIELGWMELSRIYAQDGDRRLALRTALEGLKSNRSSEKLLNRTVDLWVADELDSKGPHLLNIVEQVFGAESEIWEIKLTALVRTQVNRLSWGPAELAQLMGVPHGFSYSDSLNQPPRERDALPDDIQPAPDIELQPKVPELNPERPDSALEGMML